MGFKALATDVDRTLTDGDLLLDLQAVRTIRLLERAGVRVILLSGRDLATVGSLALYLGACGLVAAEDGALVGSLGGAFGFSLRMMADAGRLQAGLAALKEAFGRRVRDYHIPARVASLVLSKELDLTAANDLLARTCGMERGRGQRAGGGQGQGRLRLPPPLRAGVRRGRAAGGGALQARPRRSSLAGAGGRGGAGCGPAPREGTRRPDRVCGTAAGLRRAGRGRGREVRVAGGCGRRVRPYAGYIFDLDGTVYLGDRLIPGAREAVAALRRRGARVVFLSNKPLQTREHYAEKLRRLGLEVEASDVLNSSAVMAHYLERRAPGATLYVVGEEPLREELRRAGFTVLEDPSRTGWKVDYVVAAFDRTFDYAKLNHALQAIRRGARFVATNPDRTCPVDEGEVREIPDCAGMIGAIEGVTGVKVEEVVGKPSPLMAWAALERLGGVEPAECLLAGDRLETDILMGRKAGMATALVLSGVTTREAAAAAPEEMRPDYVLETIAELV